MGSKYFDSRKFLFVKVFTPFLVGFFIIAVITFISFENIYKKYQNLRVQNLLNNIQSVYKVKLEENNSRYKEIIYNIQQNEDIKKYFLEQNREKLYSVTKEIYERLNKNFNITHFYFHNLDKRVFLRVHNHNKHSDYINRYTLKQAIQTKSNFYGVEFGIFHNLTARSVFPFIINDKIVGYIELGEEIDYLTPYLSSILQSQILVTIKKDIIDINELKLFSHLEDKLNNYPSTKNYYIINSTINYYPKNLKDKIDGINNNSYIKVDDKEYEVGIVNIFDVQNKNIGQIVALVDTKEAELTLKEYRNIVIILFIFIFLMIISIYFFYFLSITNKLNQTTLDLVHLSLTDQMTKLYNRRFYNENLIKELDKFKRNKNLISFVMIDIDNFKLYNDNYGHQKGDEVIKKIANVIKSNAKRTNDYAFRLGGEEFALVIIEDLDKKSSITIAQKISTEISNMNIEHKYNSNFNKVTVSIGLCFEECNDEFDIDRLYKKSDEALYQAKEEGRNKIIVCDEIVNQLT